MNHSCLAALLALTASSGPARSSAPATAAVPADISLHANVDARSIKVERRGRAQVRVWADPDGGSAAQSSGGGSGRHFELRIDARIADRLADELQSGTNVETTAAEPR